jgi:AraC-like DNA-binding protein
MSAAHRHDDLEFNVADVDLEYLIEGRPRVFPAGTLAVFWAARPHQLMGGPETGTQAWLTVPLRDALAWRLPARIMARLLDGEVLFEQRRRAESLGALAARWQPELAGDGEERRIAALEIEAFTLRFARSVGDLAAMPDAAAAGPGRTASHGAAAAMTEYISAHAAEDLTVARVADAAHLSPTYAMTLFRSAVGITIGDYLTQCRVAAAQQLLLTTDMPVPQAGFAAGFRSQSQFYARFTQACGEAPGAYRRRLRGSGRT